MKTQQQILQNKIVAIVRRNGRSMLTQQIADRLRLEETSQLPQALEELVSDGRLVQGYTLLPNGDSSRTYV